MERTTGNKREDMQKSGHGGVSKDRGTANIKTIGLSEDLIMKLDQYPDLYPLLRLHELNQKVKSKNAENSDKIEKLKVAFKHLTEKINDVFKDQNVKVATAAPANDKKKDDKKTTAKK